MTWFMSLWAGLAVLGFAMIFSVPRRTLPGIVLLAIGAHLVRTIFQHLGMGLPGSSFMAATFVGVTAAVVAPRMNQATPIYGFAPVIPLIPGTYMFTALRDILLLTSPARPGDADLLVDNALVAGSIATLTIVGLAVGTIGPTLLAGRHIAKLVTAPRAESATSELPDLVDDADD